MAMSTVAAIFKLDGIILIKLIVDSCALNSYVITEPP